MTVTVFIVPEVARVFAADEFGMRVFANRSRFGADTLIVDQDISPTVIVNLSQFGLHRIVEDALAEVSLAQARFTNTSTFGAPEVVESPPDGIFIPSAITNTSTFGAPEVAEAPPDGILRPAVFSNASSFGAHEVEAAETPAVGSSAGTSTAAATASSSAASAGSAAGSSTASALAMVTASAAGSAAGTSTAAAITLALLAHAAATSPDSRNVTTSAIDTTGADMIIVTAISDNAGQVLTDNKGNSWTAAKTQNITSGFGNATVTLFMALSPIVGTGHTFSFSDAGVHYPALAVAAFSGINVSSALDQSASAMTGSATSLQGGSVTPSIAGELVISGLGDNVTATPGAVTQLTLLDSLAPVAFLSFGVGMAYEIQTTATPRNPTWSWTGASNAAVINATFRGN